MSLNRCDMKSTVLLKEPAKIVAFEKKSKADTPLRVALNIVFLRPFERYKMLKPYLNSLNAEKSADNQNQVQSDEDRIKSIKQHFDALTALTPQDMEETLEKPPENEPEQSDHGDIDDYDPDPGEVKNIRDNSAVNAKKHNKKKRGKSSSANSEAGAGGKKSKFDVENLDFSQYSSGVNRSAKFFDPMKDLRDKKFSGGKPQRKMANRPGSGGKSFTYKKGNGNGKK